MLRGSASLLLRLTQRAGAPARAALPLLAAFAPEAFRSMHVFARRPNANHTKVEVRDGADAGDLKNAVCAKLKLDAAPHCVRLLREVEGGGAPVRLDSRRALAEQGVLGGSSVVVEVLGHLPAAQPQRQLDRIEASLTALTAALFGGASLCPGALRLCPPGQGDAGACSARGCSSALCGAAGAAAPREREQRRRGGRGCLHDAHSRAVRAGGLGRCSCWEPGWAGRASARGLRGRGL